jgi:hypothetical protein
LKAAAAFVATVGGALLAYGLKESTTCAWIGGFLLLGGGFTVRICPDFMYRYVSYKKVSTIRQVLTTCINKRIQIYLMLVFIILIVVGGFLAHEYIRSMPLFGRVDSVWKVWCIFGFYVFIVLLITGIVTYVFRDKKAN